MKFTNPDFQTFHDWENEVCRRHAPKLSFPRLIREIVEEWEQLSNQRVYAGAIRVIETSSREVRKVKRWYNTSRANVKNIRYTKTVETRIAEREQFWAHLKDLLEALRTCIGGTEAFRLEQLELNKKGWLNGSERSRGHTDDLLAEMRAEVKKLEVQLAECERELGELDRRVAPSCESDPESSDNPSDEFGQEPGEDGADGSPQIDERGNGSEENSATTSESQEGAVEDEGVGNGGIAGGDEDEDEDDREDEVVEISSDASESTESSDDEDEDDESDTNSEIQEEDQVDTEENADEHPQPPIENGNPSARTTKPEALCRPPRAKRVSVTRPALSSPPSARLGIAGMPRQLDARDSRYLTMPPGSSAAAAGAPGKPSHSSHYSRSSRPKRGSDQVSGADGSPKRRKAEDGSPRALQDDEIDNTPAHAIQKGAKVSLPKHVAPKDSRPAAAGAGEGLPDYVPSNRKPTESNKGPGDPPGDPPGDDRSEHSDSSDTEGDIEEAWQLFLNHLENCGVAAEQIEQFRNLRDRAVRMYHIAERAIEPPAVDATDYRKYYKNHLQRFMDVEHDTFRTLMENDKGRVEAYWRKLETEITSLSDGTRCKIVSLLCRLFTTYGSSRFEPPPDVWQYIGKDGEQTQHFYVAHLRWAEAWWRFIRNMQRHRGYNELADAYKCLHDRQDAVAEHSYRQYNQAKLHMPPQVPLSELEDRLPAEKRHVAEKEAPMIQMQWDVYVQGEQAKGLNPGKLAQLAREAATAHFDNGSDLVAPPAPPPPPQAPGPRQRLATAQRPMPEKPLHDMKRVAHEARMLGFDAEKSRLPGHWAFLSSLGAGGFGHAGLWVKYDRNGMICNRVVAKEVWLRTDDRWQEGKYWQDDQEQIIPREASIGQYLSSLPGSQNIVKHLSYGVYPLLNMYRIYVEFCERSDMDQLIKEHMKLEYSSAIDEDGNRVEFRIPEPAIWCIFEALVRDACLMLHGKVPDGERVEGHYTVYHRDIKPHNIFFTKPDKRIWPSIPVPKLGDFGIALEHGAQNTPGPLWDSCPAGTPGYRAPEAESGDAKGAQIAYSRRSDLWPIGRSIICLMNLEDPNSIQPIGHNTAVKVPVIRHHAQQFYSEDLRRLVLECVQLFPNARTAVDQLYQKIQRHVTSHPPGARGAQMKLANLMPDEHIRCRSDPYEMWAK